MQPYSADIEQQMQRLYQSLNERDRRRYAAIEGIYKNGLIHFAEVPPGISESQVVVTFLGVKPTPPAGQMMSFGMFAGSNQSTEDDLQGAEFHGDPDDGLDWS